MNRALAAAAFSLAASGAAAQDDPPWRVEAEASYWRERLTRGHAPWRESALQVEAVRGATHLFGRLRSTERFSLADDEFTLGARRDLGNGWALAGEAGASGTHEVLPRRHLLLQVERSFAGGWGLHLGWRHSEYNVTGADLRMATLERYFGDQRLAYTLYSGKPEGAGSALSHRVQWSYDFAERSQVGFSLARGREVEFVPPTGVLSTDVRNATLFLRYRVAPAWIGSIEAGRHEQGTLYRRDGVRLGLRYLF